MSSGHYGLLLDFVQIQLFDFGVAILTWTEVVLEICPGMILTAHVLHMGRRSGISFVEITLEGSTKYGPTQLLHASLLYNVIKMPPLQQHPCP